MLNSANEAQAAPVAQLSTVKNTYQGVDENAADGAHALGIEIDRRIESWSIREFNQRSADTLDARRSSAMFSDTQAHLCLSVKTFLGIATSVRGHVDGRFEEMELWHAKGRFQIRHADRTSYP